MSHHLHLLLQHHQSHLHLASLFTSHLCHLPHIPPQALLIPQLDYHLWHNVSFDTISNDLEVYSIHHLTWVSWRSWAILDNALVHRSISHECPWTISMFVLNKTYLETAQTTLAWSLPLVSRTCHLWFLVSLPPSMTFHPHLEVMQPFLVSSDTNFFYHPSTYFNSLEASCFVAKWLFLHKKQLLADLCGLLGTYSPSLMTSKHSSPCLHLQAMFYIGHDWTQPDLPEAAQFCCICSSIIPAVPITSV